MIGGTRYVMKRAMPRFSAPGNRIRASAYAAGTAATSVITTRQMASSVVLTSQVVK